LQDEYSIIDRRGYLQTSIQIVKTFVRFRRMLASNKDLAKRLDDLEKKYDAQFRVVFDAIRELMTPPVPKRRKIGFRREDEQ
jgi:hypothetical protein